MSETLNGTVIWWNINKGYGIADVCGDERQIRLHKTQISYGYEEGGEFYLTGGDSIEFETHKVNPNIAKNIRIQTTPPCSPNLQEMTPDRGGFSLFEESTDEEY